MSAGSVSITYEALDEAPNPWFDPSYVVDHWDSIMGYLGEHIRLTVGAVVIGSLIALPLAVLARRSRFLAGPVLALSTIIYTIPSLAMFAFIFPFTGLSAKTVLIGLALYSLVILVRNFLTGLQGVPADVVRVPVGVHDQRDVPGVRTCPSSRLLRVADEPAVNEGRLTPVQQEQVGVGKRPSLPGHPAREPLIIESHGPPSCARRAVRSGTTVRFRWG